MKIIVTGGAGFIGSHIVDAYLAKGHEVVIIDDMSHGFMKNVKPGTKLYKLDIQKLDDMRRVMRNEKPDVINHQAAIAEVVESVRNPVPTLNVNVQGTINLLVAGGEIGVKRFIFASTGGAIYGEASRYPIKETVEPAPLSPYGLSKQLAEEAIRYYSRIYGFKHVIFRYPNVFGPRQDPNGEAGVVAIFSKILNNKQTATIYGDGTKTRDYVYVEDIARASVIGLRRGNDQTINLGWGKEISDQTVFDTIASHFPQAPAAQHKDVRDGEVVRSSLNAALAKKVLNWKPQYSFTDGVAEYIKATYSA